TPQSLQLKLQLRTLKNLLKNISKDKPVPFVIIQRIQKEIDNIKDFIRFHKLRLTIKEEPLETLLADLKRTFRRIFQKFSNTSKIDRVTFNIGTSTPGRKTSENQADPHRKWTAILNNIFSDHVFKQKRKDTDDRENQRKPEGGNDIIAQFLQEFKNLLKAHTVTSYSIVYKTRLENFLEFKGKNQDPIE
ncbi:3693_t:CDS:2, partial [Funneliformis caledonium]